SNVGEGMIAKRRTYATLFSYLTPPFMKGETYNELAALEQTLHKFTALEDPAVQHAYAKSISDRARKMGLYNDLQIPDSTRDLSVEEVNRLAELVEEIGSEKVTSGLYTLGVPYTTEQLNATVRLMAIDPIAYGLAKLDVLKGGIPAERLEQKTFMNANYTKRAEAIIEDWQQGRKIALSDLVSSEDIARTADVADAVNRIETAVNYLDTYREALSSSTENELQAIVNGLGGGYTLPSSGGDPIVNPQSVPSGRNLYSIDAEKTPSAEAWEVGKMQVRSMLEKHQQ